MPAVVSPVAGTRTTPLDGYIFVRGNTATFQMIYLNEDQPTLVDTGFSPVLRILKPVFLNDGTSPAPQVVAEIEGSLTPGQLFEYTFIWTIDTSITPADEYIASYYGMVGGMDLNFGDEYFTIAAGPSVVTLKPYSYATVDDVRKTKFNIDDFLPEPIRTDLTARNNMIEFHLTRGTKKLREELSLNKQRGFSENYNLFTVYYAIWSILLASRGEDGSSVSDQNLMYWQGEWQRILAQEKRESVLQGYPLGRG